MLVAWERVKRNRGSQTAGVDGIRASTSSGMVWQRFLGELRRSLRDRSYAPLPVREHAIPKRGSGKVRRLGIPALPTGSFRWRPLLVLEPVWRRTSARSRMAFGPGAGAQDAIEDVRRFINPPACYEWVIEGDVEDCFGSIHHGLLMAELRRRVTDKRVLGWCDCFSARGS